MMIIMWCLIPHRVLSLIPEVNVAERTSEGDKKDGESSDSGNSNDSLDRED